ncbi:MAG: hypothetical protein IKW83_10845 [Muribaculaceae bacterium]|nr:hypothetical protein [Muribaculaceae bacterium]
MTFFKNIFSAAAMMAVGFLCFSASAQPVNQVNYCTFDGGNYNVASTNDNGANYVFNRDYFELMVMTLDSKTPYTECEGIEISSITLKDNSININTTLGSYYASKIKLMDSESAETVSDILAESVYQMCNMLGKDAEGYTMIEKMKALGININYNFYVRGDRVPVKSIQISAQQLCEMGQDNIVALSER